MYNYIVAHHWRGKKLKSFGMNETDQHDNENTKQSQPTEHKWFDIFDQQRTGPPRNADVTAWSDVPSDDIRINGWAFGDLKCCDKEKLCMLLNGKRRGHCRICGAELNLKVI